MEDMLEKEGADWRIGVGHRDFATQVLETRPSPQGDRCDSRQAVEGRRHENCSVRNRPQNYQHNKAISETGD
jgi:hypothetical protein